MDMQECKVIFKAGTKREAAQAIITRHVPSAKIDTYQENVRVGCNEMAFAIVTLPVKDAGKIHDDGSVVMVEVLSYFKGSCTQCGECSAPT